MTRSPHRQIPVWGFPRGYNPNFMGDACELCRRTDNWEGRVIEGQADLVAWTCGCCRSEPVAIPE